jgi:outer membrane protein OmpA-like peptidoglycan-associated protein
MASRTERRVPLKQTSKQEEALMNVITKKLRAGALGLTLVSTCVVALPVYAQDSGSSSVTVTGKQDTRRPASKQENIGLLTGLGVGAAAGGPVGAIVGAAAGAWIGHHYYTKDQDNKALKAGLKDSEAQRMELAKNVGELNVSLADARAKDDKLDQAFKSTDALETDVGFRTNDASVNPDAMEALQKMGTLAASMPDTKVVVAGFADPRGSEKYNEELSRRRAEAVAQVLADAGVAKDHLVVEGHGKGEANSMEGDVDGYAFDRKVTVRLERVEGQEVARNDQ